MVEAIRSTEVLRRPSVCYGFRFEKHSVKPEHYERKKSALLDSMRSADSTLSN